MWDADEFTVDNRWDDDDIIGCLTEEGSPSAVIESELYRPVDSEGVASSKPHQDRCERFDGPFGEDAPDRLRHAVGLLVYTTTVFDPISDEDLELDYLTRDAEDKFLRIYDDLEEFEAAWNQTRQAYANG